MRLTVADGAISVVGDSEFPVNKGALCIKGWLAAETLGDTGRLQTPLVRNSRGVLMPASWDDALERIANGIHATQAKFGVRRMGPSAPSASPALPKNTSSAPHACSAKRRAP